MIKVYVYLLVSLIVIKPLTAQNFYHNSYSWDKNPSVYHPTESDQKSDLIKVLDRKIMDIVYDSDGQAVLYETMHTIYHVNKAKAIDGINKGYMAMRNVLEEIDLKARCITAQNKIIYFNKSTIKSVDDLEGDGPYKIFALDGVDVGCDVEVIYTNKKSFSSYAYYYAQFSSPVAHYETHILSPINLIFETKSYNGLANFKKDTSDNTKNHIYLIQKNIPPFENEKYSAGNANKMGYIMQLAYNTDRNKSKVYTWDLLSRDYYSSFYVNEKTEAKKIEKLINKAGFAGQTDQFEKLKAFDSYFKTNYEISDAYNFPFEKALENKKMNDANGIRFYIAGLKELQIPFELVLTSPRDVLAFDSKFASYVYLKEFLIYFPQIKKYVSPLSIYSRPGYAQPDLLNTYGLFIKEINIGEIYSSTSKVKLIDYTDFNDSYHNYDVSVQINLTDKTAKLNVTQTMFGYSTYYMQPIYRYLKDEQKVEVHKGYYLTENGDGVKKLEVSNTEEADLFTKPFQIKYTDEQNDFIENAGVKYIFKAGLLIGPQSELYQEAKRKMPGDMNYTHYLKRNIEILIPEGYKATNLADLNLEKKCLLNGKEIGIFKSSYEVKNNTILISVYEDYRAIDYPLDVFDDFKSVINAAADFNKKNIIFEKL